MLLLCLGVWLLLLLLWSPGVDPVPCGGWVGGRGSSRPARQPLLMSAPAGPGDSSLSCVPLTRKPPASATHKAANQLKEPNMNRPDDSLSGWGRLGWRLRCRCLRRSARRHKDLLEASADVEFFFPFFNTQTGETWVKERQRQHGDSRTAAASGDSPQQLRPPPPDDCDSIKRCNKKEGGRKKQHSFLHFLFFFKSHPGLIVTMEIKASFWD